MAQQRLQRPTALSMAHARQESRFVVRASVYNTFRDLGGFESSRLREWIFDEDPMVSPSSVGTDASASQPAPSIEASESPSTVSTPSRKRRFIRFASRSRRRHSRVSDPSVADSGYESDKRASPSTHSPWSLFHRSASQPRSEATTRKRRAQQPVPPVPPLPHAQQRRSPVDSSERRGRWFLFHAHGQGRATPDKVRSREPSMIGTPQSMRSKSAPHLREPVAHSRHHSLADEEWATLSRSDLQSIMIENPFLHGKHIR
ncbi:hypothetical protein FISHEDRAFT_73619 [Fistulina hepatica ATCC 64428]|uniref:Uncharacterized protein n=1 Tax=Fistulina hepatica ATCC 64428 TaxID=1128425 RepID=A0A0D7ABQ5_9AGAR|nr:hypothetical protein FISHEDRAFT_73619 [Fistulina hepatica ATCC 64428]